MGAGVSQANARRHAPLAEAAMVERGLTSQNAGAIFLAQVLHESAGLQFFEEIASGDAYEGRRDLGNVKPGDGRRYKGRGPIQLTGRTNYRAAGKALGLPLEQHPEMAAGHKTGWRIAAWYFSQRAGLMAAANRGDITGSTRLINGAATEGAPSHLARRRRLLKLVSRYDCQPRPMPWLRDDERRWVLEIDRLRREVATSDSGVREKRARIKVLDRVITERRKTLWRVSQPAPRGDGHGWGVNHRRERWRSLAARS
jgi:predicted chitinase